MAQQLGTAVVSGNLGAVLVSGTELVLVTSPVIEVPADSRLVCIIAKCFIAFGTLVTQCTLAIRRGTLITSPLVGATEANSSGVAASSNWSGTMLQSDQLTGQATVQYSLTALTNGGGTNSTPGQQSIAVFFM